MDGSNSPLPRAAAGGGAADGAAPDLSQSVENSPRDKIEAATGGGRAVAGDRRAVAFSDEQCVVECHDDTDDEDLSPQPGEGPNEEIIPVVIPENLVISRELEDAIWIVNDTIHMLNAAQRGETRLSPTELPRALRDKIRLQDSTNDLGRTVAIFLKRLLSSLQRIGSDNFDIRHSSNIIALVAVGFIESEAEVIIEFLAGRSLKPLNSKARSLSSRDRAWYFFLFMSLKLKTDLLDTEDGVNWFFSYATNPTVLPDAWDQASFSSVVEPISRRFGSIRAKGLTKKSERKQARDDSANADDAASVACSEFSTATQNADGPLWKYVVAFKTLSKLLNAWLKGNELLCQGRGELTDEALVRLIFRFLKRMQCSRTGTFDTDREYSAHIYESLMRAYWKAKSEGKKLILRLHDTFSAILCATCNFPAAIEWLDQAIQCQHPKGNSLTKQEKALINFALSASAMGAQTLATCSDRNIEALFLHFFNGDELKVSGADAAKIQSAIDRVAKDFETCPFDSVEPSHHAVPEANSAHGAEQVEQAIPEFHGRGTPFRGRGGH